jgi:uncharacterized membrane protein
MDASSLDQRLKDIETRLARIEASNNSKATPSPTTHNFTNEEPPTAQQPTPPHVSTNENSNWLGVIAIICFICAAALIVKLAISTGWLTEVRQIGLSYLFGATLICAGFMLLNQDREYASLLPSAGIIIFYFTSYAAFRFYSLVSFDTALILTTATSALCILIYFKIKHEIYPVTAAIGAYLAPFLLQFALPDQIFSPYYYVICSLAFAAISIWTQSRTLTMLAAYLAILVSGMIGYNLHQDSLIAIILPIHLVIFSLATLAYSILNQRPLTHREAWSFFPALLLFYAMEYDLLNRLLPGWAPWISIWFGIFIMSLALQAKIFKRYKEQPSLPMTAAFLTVIFFHSVYLELLPSYLTPWLAAMIVCVVALLQKKKVGDATREQYLIPSLAALMIVFIEYDRIIFNVFSAYNLPWITVSMAMIVSLWALYLSMRMNMKQKNMDHYVILSVSANLLAVVTLYSLCNDISSLAVSCSWLLYASLLLAYAFQRKDKIMANSALLVLSISAAKALLFDAASAPTAMRIFCLLVTGVVLYGAGLLMRQFSNWGKE